MTLVSGTSKLARLVAVGMLAGLLSNVGGDIARAQDKTLRFGHMWPPTDVWGRGAQKFADLVKSRTNGKYEVKMFPSGQLGNEREMEEGLQVGNLDFTFGGSDVMSQFEPKMAVFALPFMFRDYDHSNAVLDGPVGKKVHEALRQKGIRVLAAGAQGFRYVLTQKPINSVADMKNLKIRVPEGEVMLRLFQLIGASPVSIAWPETYMAAKNNVVDGLEGVPLVLLNFKMYETGKQVAKTRHVLATLNLVVSEKVFQALPADVQKIIEDSAKEAWRATRDEAKAGNEKAEAELAKLGVKFTSPDVKPFQDAVRPYWNEWATKNKAADIVEAIQKM
jgi:tripartite ATP-independent transporter DctP family solute receptor